MKLKEHAIRLKKGQKGSPRVRSRVVFQRAPAKSLARNEKKAKVVATYAGGLNRAASATIRGYLSQMVYVALEWVRLQPDELLVVEGQEDLDRFLFDARGHLRAVNEVQLKDLAEAINARSEEAYESIFNSLLAFERNHAASRPCKFIFVTTAARRGQLVAGVTRIVSASGKGAKRTLDLSTDLLGEWSDLSTKIQAEQDALVPKLAADIKALFAFHLGTHLPLPSPQVTPTATQVLAGRVADALSYIDKLGVWAEFLLSVRWTFASPSAGALMGTLAKEIAAHPDLGAGPAGLLAPRLVLRVFEIAAKNKVDERVLSRSLLRAEASKATAEVDAWVQTLGIAKLETWIFELDARVDALEEKTDRTARALDAHLKGHGPAPLSPAEEARRLFKEEVSKAQAMRVFDSYFRIRVAPRFLFVRPPAFKLHRRIFALETDGGLGHQLDRLIAGMEGQQTDIEKLHAALTFRYGAGNHPKLPPLPTTPLASEKSDLFDGLRELLDRLSELMDALAAWEASAEAMLAEEVKGKLEDDEQEAFYNIVRRTVARRAETRNAMSPLERLVRPIWMLTSPAGRGKSTLLWYGAEKLRKEGHLVCVLAPHHLATSQDVLELAARELAMVPPTRERFIEIATQVWESNGKPSFVCIDAINESPSGVAATTALILSAASVAAQRPHIRLLLACRDFYWDGSFAPALAAIDGSMVVDDGIAVQPVLTDDAVRAFLQHYSVRGLTAQEMKSHEVLGNPFLLRIFCETYSGRKYDGPRPVRTTAIELLDSYIESRAAELRARGFSASLRLASALTELATAMVERERKARAAHRMISFGVTASKARQVLAERSDRNQLLLDAVLDLDLVLRRDLPVAGAEEVVFAFERIESYFRALSLLDDVLSMGEEVSSEEIVGVWGGEELTLDAIGMVLGIAMTRRILPAFPEDSEEALGAFPSFADLVGERVLPVLSSGALQRAASRFGVAPLAHVAERYLLEGSMREPKGEALMAALLRALPTRPLVERHLDFIAKQELIRALTDRVETEVTAARSWVRGRLSGEPPRFFVEPEGMIEICRALLGANSSRTRDLAHEWLFWWGHCQPEPAVDFAIGLLSTSDLVVRERAIALVCGLMERRPEVATPPRLQMVWNLFLAVPPEKRSGSLDHYFITEFARRIMLDHRGAAEGVVPAEGWNWIEKPGRLRFAPDEGTHAPAAASPAWNSAGPIGSDMAHYTFGHLFRVFAVDSLQPVVDEVLAILPDLGYDEGRYEKDDSAIARLARPRSGEDRVERFGKLFAYQAAYIVLGRWAKSVPVQQSVEEPSDVFALGEPTFDYMFTMETGGRDSPIEAVIDFPLEMPWDEWEAHDEMKYLRDFCAKFPDEVVLWGHADRRVGGRKLSLKIEEAFVFPDAVPALAWLERDRDPREENYFGSVPHEPAETADFHTVERAKPVVKERIGWDEPVFACSVELIRTLHHADKSVMSPSPSVVHALGLRALPTQGEYADAAGNLVVRQVEWGDSSTENSAHLLLMRRDALEEAARRLGVSLVRFEYMHSGEVDPRADGGFSRDHFYRRWSATFPGDGYTVPPFLGPLVAEFLQDHRHLGDDARLRAYHIAVTQGESALREFLRREADQPWRQMRVLFDTSPLRTLEELRAGEQLDEAEE